MYNVGSDGLAPDEPQRVASRPGIHEITFSKGKVSFATIHGIFKAEVLADGTFGPLNMVIHDLPDAGQHNTRKRDNASVQNMLPCANGLRYVSSHLQMFFERGKRVGGEALYLFVAPAIGFLFKIGNIYFVVLQHGAHVGLIKVRA
jgi:hypothetical protein